MIPYDLGLRSFSFILKHPIPSWFLASIFLFFFAHPLFKESKRFFVFTDSIVEGAANCFLQVFYGKQK